MDRPRRGGDGSLTIHGFSDPMRTWKMANETPIYPSTVACFQPLVFVDPENCMPKDEIVSITKVLFDYDRISV